MSYSRWLHSNWYSFWNSELSSNDKVGQVLSLWHAETVPMDFSYQVLQSIGKNKLNTLFVTISDDDIDEALRIIAEFTHDVDLEFQEKDEVPSNRDS